MYISVIYTIKHSIGKTMTLKFNPKFDKNNNRPSFHMYLCVNVCFRTLSIGQYFKNYDILQSVIFQLCTIYALLPNSVCPFDHILST